jgi:DNA-binding MurR/RpiR family transcriptional regulator
MNAGQKTKLSDLIPSKLQMLSPQLRKAARYVVDNPGEVATRSQRQIADIAQLPAPTFTRLARAIGYNSYDEMRETCRVDVLQARTALADKAQILVDGDLGRANFATKHAASAIRNTEKLITNLDIKDLDAAADLLSKARRVVLIGMMSGRPVVDYAVYLANMSLTGWTVLGRDGEGLATSLTSLGPEDACITFSIDPYAKRALDIAELVSNCGVPLVALTDNMLSPAAKNAHFCFYMGADSPQFFPSHVAATVFFEILIGMVIQIKGKEAQERIAAIEQQNHNLGEYWQD